MRLIGYMFAFVLGIYLIVRGIVEFFVINWSDPASYRKDWGGPSLPGVLLVHSGPGLLALVLLTLLIVRLVRRQPTP
ncbi:MAG TPA: hypothetical protein VJY85_11645 [Candidatus Limnocylindria bacterium]|nr:hypothetical protein [Candidatus Limnocylindria bacterium]